MARLPNLSESAATTQRSRGAKAAKRKPVGGYRAPAKPARKLAHRSK